VEAALDDLDRAEGEAIAAIFGDEGGAPEVRAEDAEALGEDHAGERRPEKVEELPGNDEVAIEDAHLAAAEVRESSADGLDFLL